MSIDFHFLADLQQKILNITHELKEYFLQIKSLVLNSENIDSTARDFFVIFVLTISLNFFYLANFSLSIDDEIVARMFSENTPWLLLHSDRWVIALVDHFLFPQPVTPYVTYFIFSFCSSVAYLLLTRIHLVSNKYLKYFTLPVFVSYPIWHFITIFDATIYALGLGLVFVTLAGLLFMHMYSMENKSSTMLFISITFQSIFLSIALGSYQSFLLFYIAIVISIVFSDILSGQPKAVKLLRSFLYLGAIIAFGLFIHSFIASILRWITNIQRSGYLDTFYQSRSVLSILETFFMEFRSYYSGDMSKFGVDFISSKLLIVLFFLLLVRLVWRRPILHKIFALLIWVTLLTAPFLLHFLSIDLPGRSLFPLAYIMWFMAMLLMREKNQVFLGLNIFIILFFILQSLHIAGLYNARTYISQRYDSMLAADIYHRMGLENPDFDRSKPVMIDVYGTIDFDSLYPNPWNSTIGVSFFDQDGGDLLRMVSYFKFLGYLNVESLPNEERSALTPKFQDMPSWPAEGCVVKYDDNIYLIKLSDSPDPLHAKNQP